MIFRTLKIEEIERELFADFIRHQVVEDCWRKENDTWVVKSDPFIDDWSEKDYEELLQHLKTICLSKGFIYGAFCSGKLKGFVSVSSEKIGENKEYIDLTNIHVSEDVRRRGIGKNFSRKRHFGRKNKEQRRYIFQHTPLWKARHFIKLWDV